VYGRLVLVAANVETTGAGIAASVTVTFVAATVAVLFFTVRAKEQSSVLAVLFACRVTPLVTLVEQGKDFEKPLRAGETVILHDDAYSRLAERTTGPPR
jgi:hypothetical protein